jgi:glycosyltransferase involved in cell wall biosynthesis
MRILNVMGDAYYPQMSGGTQACLHELMTSLRAAGYTPLLLAGLWGGKLEFRSRVAMRLTRRPWVSHRWEGYEVYRKWHPWEDVDEMTGILKPDVVLIQGTAKAVGIADAFSKRGLPVSMYLHEVDFERLGGDPRSLSGVKFIANSEFTQKRMQDIYGLESFVLPPIFFDAERYSVETTRRNVTFINPVPMKGVELAYRIAELCPEIPFHFVQSWTLSREEFAAINERLASLPNVRFSRTVYDMRQIYGEAKIMLVPSQVDEAWGRVVSEAQCSGIPALFSLRGGLPEAAGDGGIGLAWDAPVEQWVEALRSLWHDEALYAANSAAARAMGEKITRERPMRLHRLIEFIGGKAGAVHTAAENVYAAAGKR